MKRLESLRERFGPQRRLGSFPSRMQGPLSLVGRIHARARSASDRAWYALQTAWALVQMIGRAVRSDTDSATSFVLDWHFEKFVSRNKGILPGWWLDAIQVSPKAA
jgi:hypothetical protein